ncbi:9270_t:CDS:1, partial [Scutellospora calospora]
TIKEIKQQAYILDYYRSKFQLDIFKSTKSYIYNSKQLDYLTKRSSLFLLKHFQKVYLNLNNSKKIQNQSKYYIAGLNEDVEAKCLPTGYLTSKKLTKNTYDKCNKLFSKLNGKVYIYGHAYHIDCYEKMHSTCNYCLQYYKKGIFSKINSFIKRLEKNDNDKLTKDDLDKDLEPELDNNYINNDDSDND